MKSHPFIVQFFAPLPMAFALVREAAKRTLGQRHFNVQLMGGIVLHEGKIVESGSHEELLDLNGRYNSLWQKQTSEFSS